jgi:hypothetical protein
MEAPGAPPSFDGQATLTPVFLKPQIVNDARFRAFDMLEGVVLARRMANRLLTRHSNIDQ